MNDDGIFRDGFKPGDVVVVTGGGGGFGRAFCRRFARAGARLAIWDVKADLGQETLRQVRDLGAEAEFYEGDLADQIFAGMQGFQCPEGGFFLWLPVADGEAAAVKAWTETGVRVLPGAYLSREVGGDNPGAGYIRIALVAPELEMQQGLIKLRDCLFN